MLAVNEKHKMNPELYKLVIRLKKMRSMEEIYATYPLVCRMNPDMEHDEFIAIQDEMMKQGYQCIGAYDQQEQLRGMCGYWVTHRFYCGKAIRIDNVVVEKQCKGLGIGSSLLNYVEKEGQRVGACSIILDAYAHNKESHDFYFKHGLDMKGVHFVKTL